jgi:hypothetical protein
MTWLFTHVKLNRLRVCGNWVLRRILGPKMDEATGEWITLRKEDFMISTHKILLG